MDSQLLRKSIKISREKKEEDQVVQEVLLFLIFFINFKLTADPGKVENSEGKEDAFLLTRNVCSTYFIREKKRILTLIVF